LALPSRIAHITANGAKRRRAIWNTRAEDGCQCIDSVAAAPATQCDQHASQHSIEREIEDRKKKNRSRE
jgi:hypothetical protein